MAATLEQLLVRIEANTEQLRRQMQQGERVVSRSTGNMERSLRRLRTAFYAISGAVGAGGLLRETIRLADSYRGLNNRLSLVTDSEEERADLLQRLVELSAETRTSVEGTTTIFFRLQRGLESSGISGERLINIIRTINQQVAISGATAAESEGALVQFSQALATDFEAAGQEIRSLQEQMPGLVMAIEDGMGIARGSFVRLAREGEISTERVIEALENVAGSTNEQFGGTNSTVGQAMTQLGDAVLVAVGAMDEATNASASLADSIADIATIIRSNTETWEDFAEFLELVIRATPGLNAIPAAIDVNNAQQGFSDRYGGGRLGRLHFTIDFDADGTPRLRVYDPTEGNGSAGVPSDNMFRRGSVGGSGSGNTSAPSASSGNIINVTTSPVIMPWTEQDEENARRAQEALDAIKLEEEKLSDAALEAAKAFGDQRRELTGISAKAEAGEFDGVINTLQEAVEGARNLEDAVNRVTLALVRMAAQRGFEALAQFIGANFSFGGGKTFSGKALGGGVSGASPYIVGENGPELFVPNAGGGSIIPNGRSSGMGSFVFNVDARGAQLGVAEQIRDAVPGIVQTIRATIRDDMGRGGAFAGAIRG